MADWATKAGVCSITAPSRLAHHLHPGRATRDCLRKTCLSSLGFTPVTKAAPVVAWVDPGGRRRVSLVYGPSARLASTTLRSQSHTDAKEVDLRQGSGHDRKARVKGGSQLGGSDHRC